MTITGFIILVLLALLAVWIYIELASLPGKIAKQREHRQADAINVLGWLGLLLGVAPWLVALVWAYTRSVDRQPKSAGCGSAKPRETKAVDEEI